MTTAKSASGLNHERSTSTADDRRGYWFALGEKAGRSAARREILEALGVTDAIAEAVQLHRDQEHD